MAAKWGTLKAAVAEVIKTNGNQEITGKLLQDALSNIISTIGNNATFAGIATPDTNPGAPDGPVFYLAAKAGTYSNFGGLVIKNTAVIFLWDAALKKWAQFNTGIVTTTGLDSKIASINYALFCLSDSAKVIFNPSEKNVTFPTSQFVFYDGNGHQGFFDNAFIVELPSSLANNLFYKKSTKTIVAYDWQTTESADDEYYIGYTYNYHIYILGVSPENITVVGKKIYTYSNYAIAGYGASTVITFNTTAKTVTFPKNNYVYIDGKGIGISSDIVVSLPSGLANNLFYKKSTKTIVAYDWQTTNSNSSADEYFIGYTFDYRIYILGVSPEQLCVIPGKSNPQVGFMTINDKNAERVVYDYANKTIRFYASSYVLAGGRGYGTTVDETIELGDSAAYNIFFSISTRKYTIYHWQNEWPTLPTNRDLYCIGYVYDKYLHIFGLNDNQIVTKLKSVYFFGDSITAGIGTSGTNCYHQFLAKALDFKGLNFGIGGIGFLQTVTLDNVLTGNGAEGVGTYQRQSGNNTILEVMQANNDFNYISIWAGTNDFGASKPLAAFKTAVEETLDYALSITPYVVCATPIRRRSPATNRQGLTLADYCEVIKTACEERGIPCFDAYNNAGLNPVNDANNSAFFTDGLHTKAAGQKRMAIGYKKFVAAMLNSEV